MKDRFWASCLIFLDFCFAALSWGLFFYVRKTEIENQAFIADSKFYLGLFLIPLFWVFFYFIQGTYHDIRRMFRLKLINLTVIASFLGTITLFFVLLIDDDVKSYQNYYRSILFLFGIHFILTVIPRLVFNTILINHIRKNGHGFKTLIIGGNEKAVEIYMELIQQKQNTNSFIGYVNVNGKDKLLDGTLAYLGHSNDLEEIMHTHEVEEVIIAVENSDHNRLEDIISRIDNGQIRIKLLPDMYAILAGSVEMMNIYGALLIEIIPDVMPFWQQAIKRLMDVVISLIAIISLIPFYLFSALAVKFSSPGPIFYLQDRVGMNGRSFRIIKFRTMYVNAELQGPQLSSEGDPRITPVGRFMRKTRLDEFPQFINVLLGQMSLVGPRPERQFYIDQIVKVEPQYNHLTKVRPGITSWGQVKYGYAENVDQMLQRMKFDLIYLKNRSLALDLKIMFYTVIIVIKAKGK
jgi:exopolysaccharide biosynthesis polyprenyl glycosylphosphotransferase